VDAPVDVGAKILEILGRDLWPFSSEISSLDEPWLFTVVEFGYDHVSKPADVWDHAYGRCGIHVATASPRAGRAEYANRINGLLARYVEPYTLAEDGLIYAATPSGLEAIEPVVTGSDPIDRRVESAIRTYRRYGASDDDKRHAIHDLADVLEYLRSTIGTGLPRKDEGELFAIANNFGVRHHSPSQKTDYSGPWLDWIFYSFLNGVHLATRLAAP
jgi:hypothetical protein